MAALLPLEDCVIVSAVRIPIGKFGGSLRDFKVYDLGSLAIKAATKRAELVPEMVDEVIISHTRQDGTGTNPARTAMLKAGMPLRTPAHTVNKVCAAGLKAVQLATHALRVGDAEIVVVGGMESMSNIPHLLRGARWKGFRLQDIVVEDGFLYLVDPICGLGPGGAAERAVERHKVSREVQDMIGYLSHMRAAQAWDDGIFDDEVVPIEIPPSREREASVFSKDECFRRDVSLDTMKTLPPAFRKDGSVTAGNSSGITDGAGAMVMMTRERAAALGKNPIASIVSYSFVGVEPADFPDGPAAGIPVALEKANLTKEDITWFEVNEAFAVVVAITEKLLGIDHCKMNPHGGGISLGHPTGYTGARLAIHLSNILGKGELGVASACGGGGLAGTLVVKGEKN